MVARQRSSDDVWVVRLLGQHHAALIDQEEVGTVWQRGVQREVAEPTGVQGQEQDALYPARRIERWPGDLEDGAPILSRVDEVADGEAAQGNRALECGVIGDAHVALRAGRGAMHAPVRLRGDQRLVERIPRLEGGQGPRAD